MVKWSRYRPGETQRVGRDISILFHDRGTRRAWVVSSMPRPHFTTGKETVPILQEAGWAPGPFWTCGISRRHRDSIPDPPARSQSLYRRSYPTHLLSNDFLNNLWFLRHLVLISAGVDDNIETCRWRGSYRTVAKATLECNTQKSCRTTYLWISTVSVAPGTVHAPQKTNVSRCWMKTTSSILPSRTPTARITLPRNCLRTASCKFLIVTD